MALILVIDDDEDMRMVTQEILESAGFEVVLASDGAQGLKLYRERPADLVITDILMPEKEGIETIFDLKQEFPKVKIIAVSGDSSSLKTPDYLSAASKLGADVVLRKPFESSVLLAAIGKVLKQ